MPHSRQAMLLYQGRNRISLPANHQAPQDPTSKAWRKLELNEHNEQNLSLQAFGQFEYIFKEVVKSVQKLINKRLGQHQPLIDETARKTVSVVPLSSIRVVHFYVLGYTTPGTFRRSQIGFTIYGHGP